MGWIRLDENIMLDDWLNSLEQEVRWVWAVFATYAGTRTPKWKVPVTDSNRMSQLLNVTPVTFQSMIDSAVLHSKITIDNRNWVVVNGPKYDYDPTRAERQRRHRERNQDDTSSDSNDSNSDDRYSTKVTPTITSTSTSTNTTTKQETEKASITSTKEKVAEDWLNFWNNTVCSECPELSKIKDISGERLKHLKVSLKKQGFNKEEVLEALKKSEHARGVPYPNSERTWTISFDNLIGKPDRQGGNNIEKYFIHLVEGKYQRKNGGLTPEEAAIIAELEGDIIYNKFPDQFPR